MIASVLSSFNTFMIQKFLRLTFRSQEIATLKSLQKSQDMSDIFPQKDIIKKMKTYRMREKIFANHIPDKELISRIY